MIVVWMGYVMIQIILMVLLYLILVRMMECGILPWILMDLNMPEIRGEVGIKLLRERLQLTTPIIILSGEIKVNTVIEMKPLDVSGFVAKGRDFESRLIHEVNRVLREKEKEALE